MSDEAISANLIRCAGDINNGSCMDGMPVDSVIRFYSPRWAARLVVPCSAGSRFARVHATAW